MSENIATQGGERIKIGAVARYFNVSVDLLRLYEREGLLIPIKSPKGTRYFSARDYEWIATLLRLVREARLNFAGIRHLLALIPCWEIHRCNDARKQSCPANVAAAAPCWTTQNCCQSERDCYSCSVYRSAPACSNLKGMLTVGPATYSAQPGAAD